MFGPKRALVAVVVCACCVAHSGEVEVPLSLSGRVETKAFAPNEDCRLTLTLNASLPEGFSIPEADPPRFKARGTEGVRVRSVAVGEAGTQIEVVFRVPEARERAAFQCSAIVPFCDQKAEIYLLKQARWNVTVAKGTVTVQEGRRGEAALTVGKTGIGKPASTEGCKGVDAQGRSFELAQIVGKKPLILLTYRTYW